ncbi:putative long-chain-fatty-acid- ligase protein [Neofusicoccum parvum]|uniref:Long-chain-fatty-acid- ligase protein n=1 Tax=Neofusicoccum parvum TaxID=310453 RepID=A0ACB5S7Z9_9PEZI|nr:putative long-chain-fatty-acid- ligase protein [Neofusicoccum parvum]
MPPPSLPTLESLTALFPPDRHAPEHSTAYIYTGVALLALGCEKRIPELWQQIAGAHADSAAAQATAARRLREALVKCSPLIGFPRAINALTSLRAALAPAVCARLEQACLADPAQPCLADPALPCSSEAGGEALFANIYGRHAGRVRAALDDISGARLGDFAVRCIYGELLADGRVLGARESAGCVFVACLAAGAGPQAKG